MDTRDILLRLDIYCNHDWNKVYCMLASKDLSVFNDDTTDLKAQAEIYAILANGYKILCLTDEEYPRKIYNSYKPPFIIYYKGSLETVEERYSFKRPSENPKRMFIE